MQGRVPTKPSTLVLQGQCQVLLLRQMPLSPLHRPGLQHTKTQVQNHVYVAQSTRMALLEVFLRYSTAVGACVRLRRTASGQGSMRDVDIAAMRLKKSLTLVSSVVGLAV